MNREQRRMMQRQGTVDKDGEYVAPQPRTPKTPKPKVEVKNTGSVFKRIVKFKDEVMAELRKVAWPKRPEVTGYSSVVIIAVLALGLLVFGLDYGFTKLIQMLFNA